MIILGETGSITCDRQQDMFTDLAVTLASVRGGHNVDVLIRATAVDYNAALRARIFDRWQKMVYPNSDYPSENKQEYCGYS
jgi:hypothetical protein